MSEEIKLGVGVLIRNYMGEYLLSRRTTDLGFGLWGTPGGHVEIGESIFDAANREVLEETNLRLEQDSLTMFPYVSQEYYGVTGRQYVTSYVLATAMDEFELQHVEPEKNEPWEWYDASNLPGPLWYPLGRVIRGESLSPTLQRIY